MIDDALIRGVMEFANRRLKNDYPLMGENHFSESDVKVILESFLLLMKKLIEETEE